MTNTQASYIQGAQSHVFDASHMAQPYPGTLTPVESSMSVFFEEGQCALPEREIEALAHWINGWNTANSKQHLLIGGAHATSRANRLRRLGFMMTLLVQLGVPQKRVHPEEDLTTSIRMGSIDDVPVDEVWLTLRESQSS